MIDNGQPISVFSIELIISGYFLGISTSITSKLRLDNPSLLPRKKASPNELLWIYGYYNMTCTGTTFCSKPWHYENCVFTYGNTKYTYSLQEILVGRNDHQKADCCFFVTTVWVPSQIA